MIPLEFDWETLEGEAVLSVVGQPGVPRSDGSLCWWSVAFVLQRTSVVLTVNNDTDEIVVTLRENLPQDDGPWLDVEPLSSVVGRKLGWCWLGWNYRGYRDTFTVGFDGIDPAYMFVAMASAMGCMETAFLGAEERVS